MLNQEQIAFYQEQGYLLVKGLFRPDEAAMYRQECHNLAERLEAVGQRDSTWGSARSTMAQAIKTRIVDCHDVQFYAAAFTRLVVDDRFTGAAADLMGEPNVQLHHTKMFIKPPEKGSPFPLHQDYPFFPHEGRSMMAAIIHFDLTSEEKGCVRVIPGSHKRGPLPHIQDGGYHLPLDEYSFDETALCEAEAGDVLFFSYLTIHGSGINTSQEARTTLLVQMRDPSDHPTVKTHESRGQGMMLRGIDPAPKTQA